MIKNAEIANSTLCRSQIKNHGLKQRNLAIEDSALTSMDPLLHPAKPACGNLEREDRSCAKIADQETVKKGRRDYRDRATISERFSSPVKKLTATVGRLRSVGVCEPGLAYTVGRRANLLQKSDSVAALLGKGRMKDHQQVGRCG